jgi:hypothetical protein
MSKNASFKGDVSGTIENQVNDWSDQSVGGTKTFTSTINSSADVMLSGSGKVSASFFYGDGTGLTNVGGTISSYTNHATNRLLAGGASSTAIKGLSEVTFTGDKLGVTGQISASLGVTGSEFHGSGAGLTNLDADNISVGSLSAARLDLASAGGLENNSNSLQINLSGTVSGLSLDTDGLQVDVSALDTGSYADSRHFIIQDGTNPPTKIQLSDLEANLNIDASKLTNTINNARLPSTISVANITGSTEISGAFFKGDGSGLINVTTAPAGADTQVQFNDGGTQAGNSSFTFGKTTGVMTVTTGSFSKISSSLIPDANNVFNVGQAEPLARWANVYAVDGNFSEKLTAVTGAVTHRFGIGTTNPQNELEVTGNVEILGDLSASSGITGSAFYGSGTTLTGVPFTSGPSTSNIVFVADGGAQTLNTSDNLQWTGTVLKATNLSASADIQAGGHITGSGDIILGNGDIILGKASAAIKFDPTGAGSGAGPLIQANSGLSTLMVDGDSTLSLQADENLNFRVGGSSGTGDLIAQLSTTHFSSSVAITSSAIVLADSPSSVISSGGNTFLDNNGNIFTGGITMQDGAGVTLNFNDNEISGSGHVSASAFFGDGSNLQNVSATPQFRFYTYLGYANVGTGAQWIYSRTNNTANANPASSIFLKWIAPGSGSLVRWVITPGTTTSNAQNGGFVTTSFLKNDITQNAVTETRTAHVTGSYRIFFFLSITLFTCDIVFLGENECLQC